MGIRDLLSEAGVEEMDLCIGQELDRNSNSVRRFSRSDPLSLNHQACSL